MSDITKAIELLTQINALLPVAMSIGKSLAGSIKGGATSPEAEQAVKDFAAVAKSVRETGQAWLDEHPG